MKLSVIALMATATVALAGCNRSNTLPDESAAGGGFGSESSSTSGAGNGGSIGVSSLDAETQRLMQQLVVYFDYDQADIKPEFNSLLAAHGQYLSRNPTTTLRLEGHADERGSREYNIGLGERRAQAVRRVLMLQGAQGAQITTVSYGEERPATTGSGDEAWRLNRRVELVYR